MWLYQGDNCWRSSSKTEPVTCVLDIDFVLMTYWLLTTYNISYTYSPHVVNHLKFIRLKEIASYNCKQHMSALFICRYRGVGWNMPISVSDSWSFIITKTVDSVGKAYKSTNVKFRNKCKISRNQPVGTEGESKYANLELEIVYCVYCPNGCKATHVHIVPQGKVI